MSVRLPKRPKPRINLQWPPANNAKPDDTLAYSRHDMASTSPSWQLAVASHLNSLTPEQARDFKSPASLEECLDILTQAATHTSRFSNLLQLFRPVISPLKRFEGALDVIVQVNAGIASPIWGPLKAVISIASDHFKTLESLAMIIYRILGSIERYSNYERLFAEDKGVQAAIGDLYGDLVDFCSRVVRFHSKHFRSVFVNFDHEFGLVSDLIAFHTSQVDLAANAAHMVQSSEAQQASFSMQETQERASILRSLSAVNIEDDLHRYNRISTTGSCDFALDTPWFRHLTNSERRFKHCLIGPPGYGKTTLSAFLIQHLQSCGDTTLYFFCKAEDSERERTLPALRTMLAQLCLSDHGAFEAVRSSFRQQGQLSVDSVRRISDLLRIAVTASQFPTLFVLVDALDECKESTMLVEALIRAIGEKLRLLTTSRDIVSAPGGDNDVLSLFDSQTRLSLGATTGPVDQYIRARAYSLPQLQQAEDFDSLMSLLSGAADGLWLSAKLLMDEVARSISIKSIYRLLKSGPTALGQLYDGILKNREAHLSEDEVRLAGQLFLWIDLDDYLSVSVSLDSDVLPVNTVRLVLQSASGGEPVLNATNLITRICCPLVEIAPSSCDTFDETVEFIHLSALHHVRQARNRNFDALPQILKPQRLRQFYRAEAAMWYLGDSHEFEESLFAFRGASLTVGVLDEAEYPFHAGQYFHFGYGLWSLLKIRYVADKLDHHEISEISRVLQRVVDFLTSSKCLKWVTYALVLNITGGWVKFLGRNIAEALAAVYQSDATGYDSNWIAFNRARRYFMENYLAILYETSEWDHRARKALAARYSQSCGISQIPAQYRFNDDPALRCTPLDAIHQEAKIWQERMRARSWSEEDSMSED